jgi:hypothetical protein
MSWAGSWHGRAFGLEVVAVDALPGISSSNGTASPPGRLSFEVASGRELDRMWRPREASELVASRLPDGRLIMRVDRHETLGYRVFAPRYGRHLVSADGTRLRSAFPTTTAWRWQRLLFAQALPLAATLQGLELLHASAVVADERVVAFVATSGTGKSSVAAHLVARGATFMTDDVLAIESVPQGIMAHPGAAFATLAREELASIPLHSRSRLGTELGRIAKVFLAPEVVGRPHLLARIYFLDRSGQGADVRIESGADPNLVLGATFLSYLQTPQRLLNHLAICAAIEDHVKTFRVFAGRSSGAAAVARAVEAHLGGKT